MGVMYVRSLLAQAGLSHGETPGGEDHNAVDMWISFRAATVTAQIKTGTKSTNADGSISVSTTPKWRSKWAECLLPVYLVYVRLERTLPESWIEHGMLDTTLHARALWVRANRLSEATVRLPATNRLALETFGEWESDINSGFGKAADA